MQIRYQKDFNHSYLMIEAEGEVEMETYPIRLLLGNSIDALLPCKIQTLNGTKEFCYEITGRQSVAARFSQNKIREGALRDLLLGFMKAISTIQTFLMDTDQLVVLPEYMYYDEEKEILKLCYLPGYAKDIQTQFRELLEYFLPLIDHQDSEAVVMGYGIYRQTMEDGFSLDQMKEYLYREHREEEEVQAAVEQKSVEEDIQEEERKWRQEVFQEHEEHSEKTQEKNTASWETVLVSAVWTIVLLGICVLRYLGYLPFLTFPMLLSIFIVALGVLTVNTYLRKRHKTKEGQKAVVQASIQWPGKKAVEPEEIQKIYQEEKLDFSTNTGTFDDKTGSASVDLGDTQPLPKLNLPKGGRLVSKKPECLPDIELMGDLTILGKLRGTADVVIPQPTVSRIHAKIRRVDQEYYLTDLNSRNGTYLNGKQISNDENRRITQGDEISFADAEYTFFIS